MSRRAGLDSGSAGPGSRTDLDRALLRLIGLAYEAAEDEVAWQPCLESFSDAVRGTIATVQLHDFALGRSRTLRTARWEGEALRGYNEHYGRHNPWRIHGEELMTLGNVWLGEMILTDETLLRTDFCRDYLQKVDAFYTVAGTVAITGTSATNLSVVRPKRAGPFDDRDLALVRELVPHVTRVLRLARRIEAAAASPAPTPPRVARSFEPPSELTRTEARLAEVIVGGTNLREAAEDLGMAYETARKHLARIFVKTGTHRQAELVSKLARATAG